jgi:GGDEF domain-containing protein
VSALFLAHENHLGRLGVDLAVARDITDLKDAERRLRQLATHDYPTGLPNRVLLYDRLEQALARFHRHASRWPCHSTSTGSSPSTTSSATRSAMVLVDIGVRSTPSSATDTAARIGGDEFAVLSRNRGPGHAALSPIG